MASHTFNHSVDQINQTYVYNPTKMSFTRQDPHFHDTNVAIYFSDKMNYTGYYGNYV